MRKDITIFGSGIIGIMTAYFALKNNYTVTLIEKNSSAGLGASFQNGGQLSFSHIFSVCDINIFKYLLKNSITSNTPININYLEAIKNLQWCIDFLQSSHKTAKNYDDLFNLAHRSHIAFNKISQEIKNISLNKPGSIQIFRQESSFKKVQNLINFFDKYQINHRVISELEISQIIPNYVGKNNRAIYFPDDMCGNAYDFILNILEHMKLNKNFTYLNNQNIQNISITDNNISKIITDDHEILSEKYIVTPGSYTENFTDKIKVTLPVQPLKGYSFNHKTLNLKKCIIDHDSKIVYTPLNNSTRISGLYDFAGFNSDISNKRLKFIKRNINSLIKTDDNIESYSDHWCGFRPLTSDKLPIIGNSKKYSNLYYNIGHANLGFTLSTGSSEALINSLDQGEDVIPKSFHAKRFNI
jgi:glycine/D-amino acid oxidase-like deaminating enzyme